MVLLMHTPSATHSVIEAEKEVYGGQYFVLIDDKSLYVLGYKIGAIRDLLLKRLAATPSDLRSFSFLHD